MMKSLNFFIFLFVGSMSFAQSQQKDWQITPFKALGFTENLDRYEDCLGEEVQFFADYGPYKIFFSADAFIFRRCEELSPEKLHEIHEKMEHGEIFEPIEWSYFKIEFQNTNLESVIKPLELKRFTRNFQNPNDKSQTIKAKSFDVLIYENLYPNIDLRLELPEDGGLKYNFLVHPGGDYSLIEMEYSGAEVSLLDSNNLSIHTEWDDFRDSSPESNVGDIKVESEFHLQDNTISFIVAPYDTNLLLVIDPWIVTDIPLDIVLFDNSHNVAYDNAGNCIIAGNGIEGGFDRKVAQYNSSGELNWLYEGLYGRSSDMTTNPSNGDIYPLAFWYPGQIDLINSSGEFIVDHQFIIEAGVIFGAVEGRAVKYNTQYNQVCIGNGGLYGDTIPTISKMSSSLSEWNTYEVLFEEGSIAKDPVMFDLDPQGDFIYFGIADAPLELNSFGGRIYKVRFDDPNTILWDSNMGFYLHEGYDRNGMTCGADFLYTVHSNKLKKWDKNTGEPLDSIVIDYPTAPRRGGIATDNCGNLYIGQLDSIIVYNSELVQVGGFNLPGPCSDIAINNGVLYACGTNFVMKKTLDIFDIEMSSTFDFCASCSGTATVEATNCFNYELSSITWSPSGQITPTAADLCEGWHVANTTWLTDSGELISKTDSIEVFLSFESEFTVELGNDTTLCEGEVFSMDAGSEFVSFLWQNGETGQFFTADSTGLYWVEVLDENDCLLSDSINITFVDCLSVSENELKFITVSPNPFYDYTTIYFGEALQEKHVIIISDILGQEVYRNENVIGSQLEIKKEQLAVGIFFLTLYNADLDQIFMAKLVVE